jgi:hypothetical protein
MQERRIGDMRENQHTVQLYLGKEVIQRIDIYIKEKTSQCPEPLKHLIRYTRSMVVKEALEEYFKRCKLTTKG